MKNELVVFDEKKMIGELEKGHKKAKKLLKDKDKMEEFLEKLERKLRKIPKLGKNLAMLPSMISLVRSFSKGEYKDIPFVTILSIVSALIYFLAPTDVLLDVIPGVGFMDDAFVIGMCMKGVNMDIEEYIRWRERKKEQEE